MTLRKREKKFQHPQIWAGRARGGRARQGADGRAPPPQLQGRRRGGGSRRGSAEPGHRRHGRPGPSGAEAELTAPPSPRTAGGGAAVPPVRPAPGSNGGGPGRPPTSVPEEVF